MHAAHVAYKLAKGDTFLVLLSRWGGGSTITRVITRYLFQVTGRAFWVDFGYNVVNDSLDLFRWVKIWNFLIIRGGTILGPVHHQQATSQTRDRYHRTVYLRIWKVPEGNPKALFFKSLGAVFVIQKIVIGNPAIRLELCQTRMASVHCFEFRAHSLTLSAGMLGMLREFSTVHRCHLSEQVLFFFSFWWNFSKINDVNFFSLSKEWMI